jgi:hypothetical protein
MARRHDSQFRGAKTLWLLLIGFHDRGKSVQQCRWPNSSWRSFRFHSQSLHPLGQASERRGGEAVVCVPPLQRSAPNSAAPRNFPRAGWSKAVSRSVGLAWSGHACQSPTRAVLERRAHWSCYHKLSLRKLGSPNQKRQTTKLHLLQHPWPYEAHGLARPVNAQTPAKKSTHRSVTSRRYLPR